MTARAQSRPQAAALRYAALGWAVLPLHAPDGAGACSCGRPDCPKPGKHPGNRRGVHDASSSAQTIRGWWLRWPNANVGVATGRLLVVLDVDGNDGAESLRALQAAYAPLPATLEAATCRGRHLYFAAPAEALGNSAGRLGEGLDVRGYGGYVVAPPSRHADGHRYRWRTRRPPAVLPAWITHLLLEPATAPAPAPAPLPTPGPCGDRGRRYLAVALRGELAGVAAAQPGTRNDRLNRAAFRLGQLVGNGAVHELEQQLLAAALAAGLTESESRATIASGLGAGQRHPRP